MTLQKIMDVSKKIWKRVSRIDEYYRAKMRYPKIMKKAVIDSQLILLESQHGSCCDGNIFYLIKELSNDRYSDYRVCLSARASKAEWFESFLKLHGIENVEIVILSSDRYFQVLASAKYLINDNTFLPFFVKKPGQIYLNTWHGTPLKTLGKCSKDAAATIGNTQRNFCQADYILAPNEHTLRSLQDGYMLENLSSASFLLGGYPRNEAFFDVDGVRALREREGMDSIFAIAYMPTWRSYGGFADKCAEAHLLHYLCEIDKKLTNNQRMYVNLHPVAKKTVDFSAFEKIFPFPNECETYEFLNCCDCLVSDYSSVIFDFLPTRKKIILFAYDFAEYSESRGFLFSPRELGLPVVETVDGLLDEIEKPVNEMLTSGLISRYACLEGPDASHALCRFLLNGNEDSLEVRPIPSNGKENILMYVGDLARNGITTSFRSLLEVADGFADKNIFFVTKASVSRSSLPVLDELSKKASYLVMTGKMNLSFVEKGLHYLYKQRLIPFSAYRAFMDSAYERERERLFGFMRFDQVIHFSGYEYRLILLFGTFSAKKSIFVHNNMVDEIKLRRNQRKPVLKYAYRRYDKVALVSEDMRKPTRDISGSEDNFVLVQNTFDFNRVLSGGGKAFSFDDFTKSNMSFESVVSTLDSSGVKLITIGRFSPEKAHRRLIEAFGKTLDEYPDACLIIVGGSSYPARGTTFEDLKEWVSSLEYAERVILVQGLSNPYALLSKCDGFILPSKHEGLGLVLLEAAVLGLPIVATDIPGPRGFMNSNGGLLVPNSDEGVRRGVQLLLKGEVPPIQLDCVEYNKKALESFSMLLK